MKEFPLPQVCCLLEPGPVVLLTTSRKGHHNVMTMSWHMMMDFDPPLIGCVVSPGNFSQAALRSTRECVLAIPGVDLLDKVIGIGNCSGEDVDKFEEFHLTPQAAARVQAPLVGECLANIECRVVDTTNVRAHAMYILEGVQAWQDTGRTERRTFHAHGDGTFVVDGRTLERKALMTKWQSLIRSLSG